MVQPQRTITKEQHDRLVSFLKASGPPHSTAVRHAQGNLESRQYADQIAAAIVDSGWTVNPRPIFLIELRVTVGVSILVNDVKHAPACAVTLQQALKAINIDAPGENADFKPTANEPCEIAVGAQK